MTTPQPINNPLHLLLWVAQLLLALMLFMGAGMKLFTPIPDLAAMMPWAGQVPPGFVYLTGALDALGGIGLILPALLRIKPGLTVWAAIGGAALMIAAIIFHVSRGESSAIGFNIGLLLVAVFIAWGRAVKAPISAKS